MKFKLDENLANRTRTILEKAGFDVETVLSENLVGSPDEVIFNVCQAEERCLITLDLDFADIIRYPPKQNPGIIVLRFSGPITLEKLETAVEQIIKAMQDFNPAGKLWIVEPGRLRIHRD